MKNKEEDDKTEVSLHFRIPKSLHERLRECSFKQRKSLAELSREALEMILKKYEKNS